MKHPHCNRSRAAHLFWCRGFAPVVFILAIALIVVAIGSGIYFAVVKETAQAPSPQEAALLPVPEVIVDATSPIGATSTIPLVATAVTAVPKKSAVTTTVNCGAGTTAAEQCIAEHIKTCSSAKGTFVDPSSGLTVERIVDGYKGNLCSYRTNIISGQGDLALLAGMDINCMLPKATLVTTAQGGSMSKEDLFAYCTGTFMDLMREQMGL